jgi:hypothetical protein
LALEYLQRIKSWNQNSPRNSNIGAGRNETHTSYHGLQNAKANAEKQDIWKEAIKRGSFGDRAEKKGSGRGVGGSWRFHKSHNELFLNTKYFESGWSRKGEV